ncbi:Rab family GTPase [Candidatus Poriferisocius sp.]|uniref:Rab family GTPase n=1 Tax=Candidatus Poriferisocius sp. TaxID=3101276 RepID=UPI003B02EBD6
MDRQKYTASLSQTQGRTGYSIIFRHPVRRSDSTGRPGLRVRSGLGTRDEREAARLRDELNVLLGNPKYHDLAARSEAERRFDSRVVNIFYDKMVPEQTDFTALRDAAIELPESAPDGYRRVLFLGTTGAGKTTLVRQLIGTDPIEERFPSTSTAKTTIHDTEIVIAEGDWRAVVTFASRDEVREYLNECVSDAVLAGAREADDAEVLRRLLNHANQRFRFNYVLGNGPAVASSSSDFDDEDLESKEEEDLLSEVERGTIDVKKTTELLAETIGTLRNLANRHREGLYDELEVAGDDDKRAAEEIYEEELDKLLRDDEDFHQVSDALMEEIEKRFELLPPGEIKKTRQGWPLTWSGEWPFENRAEFLSAISCFTSNYAPLFGRLLTPLVNGIRVSGPFTPAWNGSEAPKLVLFDGEGLGHTPNSSSAVSTAVSRRIEVADAVLLVDNATQPMQAATLAAMREVVASGNARKLIIAFTHFDEVKGDNLPNASARAQHVLASANNVLAAFGEELGPYAERALRLRVEQARFFLGDIHEPLNETDASGRRTVSQLRNLLECIYGVIETPESAEAKPVYDRMNLVLAIRSAADAFHRRWRPLLGLESNPALTREHWTRVKALSRRLGTGMDDEYDTLKPVADLRNELQERSYLFVQNPLRWEEYEPTDDQKQDCFDAFAHNLNRRLLEVCTRRVWKERAVQWEDAYYKRGTGSTVVRARIIGNEIYEPAAPVPDATPSPDRNQFLHEIVAEVEQAAHETNVVLE